ncbi:9210_t:CDS:2 [Acaulospora morrowiae]|uniref:9210_t:CDS:1 n=1 Tax=Acaulospora morrowiae TaxID=94023 RepID=A0A9N9E8Y3_9GLOM|nr:9210_t:CDS:2 [Acaulospora morrowiae]
MRILTNFTNFYSRSNSRINTLLPLNVYGPTRTPLSNSHFPVRFSTVVTTLKKNSPKIKLRPLPVIKSKAPRFMVYGVLGASFWIISITLSFNHQRANSSTVQGSLFNVRYHPKSIELLGNNINFSSSNPWISGSINHLKGVVNFRYSVKGDNGKGIVRFHSIRTTNDEKWRVLEFSLTTEDGTIISLKDDENLSTSLL